jgi:dihydrofolate reductase
LVAKNKTGSKSVVEFAELIDNIDKIVFSKTLKSVEWRKTMILQEVSKEERLRLKQKPGKDIVISGSPSIAEELILLELIDKYYFLVQPRVNVFLKRGDLINDLIWS